MMDRQLTPRERYEERKFLITTLIHDFALLDLDENALGSVLLCAERLRSGERYDDEELFRMFEEWL